MHHIQPDFKPVYIFGAGASKAIGAPLINDFLSRSKELIYSPDFLRTMEQDFMRDKLRGEFEKLFQYQKKLFEVKEFLGGDLNNLETLFSILDMDWQVNTPDITLSAKFPPLYDKRTLEQIREAFLSVIIATLKVSIHQKRPNYELIVQSLAANENASFITFNYDNAIEKALEAQMDRGVRKYIVDFGYAKDEIPDVHPHKRMVLKLHGSADWTYCHQCGKLTPYREYITPLEVESVRASLHDPNCPNPRASSLIVPPTWYKLNYLPELTRIWNRAISEISFATHLFIVGYSFPRTDAFFDQLLTLGMRSSRNLKRVVVINPDERIREILESFFDQHFYARSVTFLRLKFENMMESARPLAGEGELNSYLQSLSTYEKQHAIP